MTGFKPRVSGIGSDHSTNCATTTVLSPCCKIVLLIMPNENETQICSFLQIAITRSQSVWPDGQTNFSEIGHLQQSNFDQYRCAQIGFEKVFFKYGPIPASFSFSFFLFTSQINYKLKKRRWSSWDSNQGPQDGRRRRNHGAMAATRF